MTLGDQLRAAQKIALKNKKFQDECRLAKTADTILAEVIRRYEHAAFCAAQEGKRSTIVHTYVLSGGEEADLLIDKLVPKLESTYFPLGFVGVKAYISAYDSKRMALRIKLIW